MAGTIQLLGPPRVMIDGQEALLRGRKARALLGYLLTNARPTSRHFLVDLLFEEADDPLGALRWNLAHLRRQLSALITVVGDPVTIEVSPTTLIDLTVLDSGFADAVELPGFGHPFLEGLDGAGSVAFDTWLVVERSRRLAQSAGILIDETVRLLARDAAEQACEMARRLVALDPYDENHHHLLVQALSSAGDPLAARAQVARCTDLMRRELGCEPSASLAAAVRAGWRPPPPRGAITAATVEAEIDSGESAVAAGVVEPGIATLQQAVVNAESTGKPELLVRALIALGSALIHSVQGQDTEGAAALMRALDVAESSGPARQAGATACREMAWVHVQRGRHDQVQRWLARAETMVGDRVEEQAKIAGVWGLTFCDVGRRDDALAAFDLSVRLAREAGSQRQRAWALSMRARCHQLNGEAEEATELIDESLALCRAEHWMAFLPWPEIQRAELALGAGDTTRAAADFEHAFRLAELVSDPCWLALASAGSALVADRTGQGPDALRRVEQAWRHCTASPDTYTWVRARVLDVRCTVAARWAPQERRELVDQLTALAVSSGLAAFLQRADRHRRDLTD